MLVFSINQSTTILGIHSLLFRFCNNILKVQFTLQSSPGQLNLLLDHPPQIRGRIGRRLDELRRRGACVPSKPFPLTAVGFGPLRMRQLRLATAAPAKRRKRCNAATPCSCCSAAPHPTQVAPSLPRRSALHRSPQADRCSHPHIPRNPVRPSDPAPPRYRQSPHRRRDSPPAERDCATAALDELQSFFKDQAVLEEPRGRRQEALATPSLPVRTASSG